MEENFFKKKVENIEVKKRKLSELIDLLTFTHILSAPFPRRNWRRADYKQFRILGEVRPRDTSGRSSVCHRSPCTNGRSSGKKMVSKVSEPSITAIRPSFPPKKKRR